jgi:hypothetical protein
MEAYERSPEAQALGRLPERADAAVDGGVAPGVAVDPAVQEPVETLARRAPAQAKARIELVVVAALVRFLALDVVRESVHVHAEPALRGARGSARRQ